LLSAGTSPEVAIQEYGNGTNGIEDDKQRHEILNQHFEHGISVAQSAQDDRTQPEFHEQVMEY